MRKTHPDIKRFTEGVPAWVNDFRSGISGPCRISLVGEFPMCGLKLPTGEYLHRGTSSEPSLPLVSIPLANVIVGKRGEQPFFDENILVRPGLPEEIREEVRRHHQWLEYCLRQAQGSLTEKQSILSHHLVHPGATDRWQKEHDRYVESVASQRRDLQAAASDLQRYAARMRQFL